MEIESAGSNPVLVERANRGILHFKGEQAGWFLDQLVTNAIESIPAGGGAEALLLTPNGRITHHMRVVFSGSSFFVDVESGYEQELRLFFESRIFSTKVEIADRTGEFDFLTVLGDGADEVVGAALSALVKDETEEQRAIGMSLPSEDEHHTTHFGSTAVTRITRPVRGLELWAKRDIKPKVVEAIRAAGADDGTDEYFANLCAFSGLQVFGRDFDSTYLPQEAALERAVHFSKGCYLGQEAVAMTQRGTVKRKLRHLHFDSEAFEGEVFSQTEAVGRVSSVANFSGAGRAIATLKTSVPMESEVEVRAPSGRTARVQALVLPGSVDGPKVPSGRELRERLGR